MGYCVWVDTYERNRVRKCIDMSRVFVIPDIHLKPWIFDKVEEELSMMLLRSGQDHRMAG